ncbi:hypothetical protein IAH97_00445 [Neoehrlichia mikurensis]|uniref:Uncharacterized protein n=1 Tax=Neoehrlichia mikurensis TaxID=89586 RepID=A0A9Q9BZA9_9RICK|nr:hypothetical protein [Neoehrlichia mikurensis]QXK92043.1 hypothetical protein IAH97_00445 [Neoehrlichia mikurensis]QXK92500.1 hypothetical protein HUN61_00445 [Neoehrlichia mikurensis]UTO55290.1 hypothetical protein LUA82_03835 [Neoehrlichia mikurensis]UTO56211.1 hypothetical protein LUA81_03800 [Neoehrlichia mikurensis]
MNNKLIPEEEHELQVIKHNYHRYGDKLRIIAYNRVGEIKYKMLPCNLQITDFYAKLDAFPITYDYYVRNLKYIVLVKQQYYISLPQSSKEELSKFKCNLIDSKDLSQQSVNYLKNQSQSFPITNKK